MEVREKTLTVDGERLKALRKQKKIRIPTILNYVGCARSTYTNWEQGHRTPGAENLNKLAEILETSTDYLYRKTDDPSPSNKRGKGTGTALYFNKTNVEYNGMIIEDEKKKQLLEDMLEMFFKSAQNEK